MTSKEAVEELIDTYISWRAYQTRECIENDYRYKKVLKDLDRLERLEKENKELKNKNSALELWNDCYTKENSKLKKAIEILKQFYCLEESDIHNEKLNLGFYGIFKKLGGRENDSLIKEEYKLLKEVLENE